MAEKATLRIEGLKELIEGLREELPKATSNNVIKRALLKAGVPMERDAKQNAPVGETGLLKERINISTKLSPRQKGLHKKESKYEVFVGPPSMSRGIVAEFGSVKQTAKPFMRPAWDANKKTAFNSLKKDIGEEIEKARKRIAAKAARQLAKIKGG